MELKYKLAIAITILVIIFIILVSTLRKKIKRTEPRPYEERSPGIRKLIHLPIGETIIVVSYDAEQRPIVQFVHDFQEEMRDREGMCFVLDGAEKFELLKGKTYEVNKADAEGSIFLKQVALFITEDYAMG